MTSECELLGLDQDFFDRVKRTCDLADDDAAMAEAHRIAQQEEAVAIVKELWPELVKIAQRLIDDISEFLYQFMKDSLDTPLWEAPEEVTRGLRDRSPTTRTTSAKPNQPSGARDALREGCRKGLLLYPGL